MQDILQNYCQCFCKGKNSHRQKTIRKILFSPREPNNCTCALNTGSRKSQTLLICCTECIAKGSKDSEQLIPSWQGSCAQQRAANPCNYCACGGCSISFIRKLCKETWDAYQKENTYRERYSIFEGGPLQPVELQVERVNNNQILTRNFAEDATDSKERRRTFDYKSTERTPRRVQEHNVEDYKKVPRKNNKHDKWADDEGKTGQTKKKKSLEVSDILSDDEVQKMSEKKKGNKRKIQHDSVPDKKNELGTKQDNKKITKDQSDGNLYKAGKDVINRKSANKNDAEKIINSEGNKKSRKGKSKQLHESDDAVVAPKGQAKNGWKADGENTKGITTKSKIKRSNLVEQFKNEDISKKGSRTVETKSKNQRGKLEMKESISANSFQDGDKIRKEATAKGRRVSAVTEDPEKQNLRHERPARRANRKGNSKGRHYLENNQEVEEGKRGPTSDKSKGRKEKVQEGRVTTAIYDDDDYVQPEKYGQKVGSEDLSKAKYRRKDKYLIASKRRIERELEVSRKEDIVGQHRQKSLKYIASMSPRKSEFSGRGDQLSFTRIESLYRREKNLKSQLTGRRRNTSDYMRLRLEESDLKRLAGKRSPDPCCVPSRPDHPCNPCGPCDSCNPCDPGSSCDPYVGSPINVCCPGDE